MIHTSRASCEYRSEEHSLRRTALASGSILQGTMSTGTARLKRRLDEQGVNYTSKKAAENYCLVRLSAKVFPLYHERERTSRLDRHSTATPREERRERIRSIMETRCTPDKLLYLRSLQRERGTVGSG